MEKIFIAMTQNYWGKGATVEAAKKACKKAGSSERITSKKWLVKLMPEGVTEAWVDYMGCMLWRFAQGADDTKVPITIETPSKK